MALYIYPIYSPKIVSSSPKSLFCELTLEMLQMEEESGFGYQ